MNDESRVLKTHLGLSENEVALFVYLIKNGRRSIDQIETDLDCTSNEAAQTARALVDKGMVVQISKLIYTPLHPKFAIVNRYREKCREDNIQFHKNALIDSIGSRMEKYFEHTNV
ncbi:MAG TPA: helix-turn-helix domain-containing protein [Nitrososphaeraceae archaeon]|jgi:predicted transcriptional regulator